MSLNISPASAAPRDYTYDMSLNGDASKTADADVQNLTSVKDLQKIEREGEKISPGDEQFIKKLDRILKSIQGPNTSFEMSVHKETNTIMIKVMNKDTGELIREIPPEKTLDLVAKFMEINGILIDEKV